MNPNTELLLSRLQKVKGRNGSWVACCPAHKDRSPSLTIRETPEGKILLHCFAGCEVADVVGALAMDLTDLFPPESRTPDYAVPHKRTRFLATELLQAIALEATIVSICAYDLSQGKALREADYERLRLAASRINEALEASR